MPRSTAVRPILRKKWRTDRRLIPTRRRQAYLNRPALAFATGINTAVGMDDSFKAGHAQSLKLPRRLDLPAAGGLKADFLTRSGHPVRVDAAEVSHLGGLCLQVLLAAAAQWRQDNLRFDIEPRSAPFEDALATFGISRSALEHWGSA